MPGPQPLDTTKLESKLAWEKPERKDQAGSLVIFGGVSLKLKEVDTIFKSAKACGIGSVQTLVPESLARVFKREDQLLTPVNFDSYYGLTDSGLRVFTEEFAQADALVLADIGKSSATEHRLAVAIAKTFKPVIITDSSVNLALTYCSELLDNSSITLLLSLQSAQKLIKAAGLKLTKPLLSDSSFNYRLEVLYRFNSQFKAKLVLLGEKHLLAVYGDCYFNHKLESEDLNLAARLSCWQVWTPKLDFLEQLFAVASNL